jgi:mono/diheme cytochrome c family protein
MASPTGGPRYRSIRLLLLVLLLVGALGAAAWRTGRPVPATEQATAPKPVPVVPPLHPSEYATYLEEIKPILRSKCVSCHGPERRQGGLRLDSAPAIAKGGRHGPVVVAGRPEQSALVRRLSAPAEERMPKDEPALTPDEIRKIARWVADGAKAPDEAEPPKASTHWAFRPPLAPAVPPDVEDEWAGNPIDRFVADEHRRRGLRAAPLLDPGRLLRRVSIDLTGLPPTLEELRAFLNDSSPDAYVRAVDRLLDGPRYGERWARHWMDVWRYTDEDGRLNDKGEALKSIEWGSPYLWRWRDWIIRSLNADKGFDRMIREMIAGDELNPNDPESLAGAGLLVRSYYHLDRDIFLTDLVDHLPRAFFGLSMNCARCHDHRFDPITQEDYYRFRAFFETTEVVAWTSSQGPRISVTRPVDRLPGAKTYVLDGGDFQRPLKDKPLAPGVPEVLQSAPLRNATLPAGLVSSGRRLALADWMVDPRHPLTARVAVNHIWARHFGRGLVATLDDFGTRGKPPSHPALLDWLAVEFPRHGWKLKWLHRLIVTSRAYRTHSAGGPGSDEAAARDPENLSLWKFPSRRVEAEVLRDSLLHLAGRLDARVGGPSEDPDSAEISVRRSLYFRSSRGAPVAFLRQFDPPSLEECYERGASILPQQALTLLNSEFVWRQAEAIASRLGQDPPDFVSSGFLLILGRAPTERERSLADAFLAGPDGPTLSRSYLIHALVNHNDFIQLR